MMSRKSKSAATFTFQTEGERQKLELTGRDAWALSRLIKAGEKGVTPITEPGPRWSGYIFNLRRAGLSIETRYEPHRGPFPGTHARYILRDAVCGPDPYSGAAND
jgi:winged helix domain-containing protein